jgi:hypothetical protein
MSRWKGVLVGGPAKGEADDLTGFPGGDRLPCGFSVSVFFRFKPNGFSVDLFNNPVGYRTSPCKMLCILLFFSGCCLKTSVFKQLSSMTTVP